jgi:hypothetical protein
VLLSELEYVISIGFVVCMAICIPFGYLNLVCRAGSLLGAMGFSCVFSASSRSAGGLGVGFGIDTTLGRQHVVSVVLVCGPDGVYV